MTSYRAKAKKKTIGRAICTAGLPFLKSPSSLFTSLVMTRRKEKKKETFFTARGVGKKKRKGPIWFAGMRCDRHVRSLQTRDAKTPILPKSCGLAAHSLATLRDEPNRSPCLVSVGGLRAYQSRLSRYVDGMLDEIGRFAA